MTNLTPTKLQELKTESLKLGYKNIVPMLTLEELIEYKEIVITSIERATHEDVKVIREALLVEVEAKIEELTSKTSSSKIERTGVKMLTAEEYNELRKNHMPVGKVVSSFYTATDKGKEVIVQLRNDGSITYTYLKNGELTLKRYWINTPKFKYVYDEDKIYKKKLPNWITEEELKELY